MYQVKYFTIELDSMFPYVMLAALITVIQQLVVNFMGGRHRRTSFSPEHLK